MLKGISMLQSLNGKPAITQAKDLSRFTKICHSQHSEESYTTLYPVTYLQQILHCVQ